MNESKESTVNEFDINNTPGAEQETSQAGIEWLQHYFVIEYSPGYFDATCGLCGQSFEFRVPLSVRLRGHHSPICDSCAAMVSPQLLALVQRAEAEHNAALETEAAGNMPANDAEPESSLFGTTPEGAMQS